MMVVKESEQSEKRQIKRNETINMQFMCGGMLCIIGFEFVRCQCCQCGGAHTDLVYRFIRRIEFQMGKWKVNILY